MKNRLSVCLSLCLITASAATSSAQTNTPATRQVIPVQTEKKGGPMGQTPAKPVFVTEPFYGEKALALMPPATTCPLPQSALSSGLRFNGKYRHYKDGGIGADTWYPSWAADGTLYSCYADGAVTDVEGHAIFVDCQWRGKGAYWCRDLGWGHTLNGQFQFSSSPRATYTGNAVLTGDDAFHLTVLRTLPSTKRDTQLFEGYYPCANLYYKGIWYYGGYFCHRWLNKDNIPITYEMGPFGGFRISRDQGNTWEPSPFDEQNTLFPEKGRCVGEPPIKIGSPHFVDFGRELEHSPDGNAYLAGHGTLDPNGIVNWSSGDAIFLARVKPSPETMNNTKAYEFFSGNDATGKPVWSRDFSKIQPIIKWPGHAGCVNITYHPYLKRYFAFMCSGWADGDAGSYDTWVVESPTLTGPWKNVAYLKGSMGGQPYFVCMPSKFLKPDSNILTLFYSANWRPNRIGLPASRWTDPDGPTGAYSLNVAEFELKSTKP